MSEWRAGSMAKTCLTCLELGALPQKHTFIKLATSGDDITSAVEYTMRIYYMPLPKGFEVVKKNKS